MQIINIVDDLPKHPTKVYSSRALEELLYAVIHHSGVDGQDPWDYANYHVKSRNWPGIGYEYVIQPDGKVYKTNNLTTVSYHVGAQNRYCAGICLSGNFNEHPPTKEQYYSLVELLKILIAEYKLQVKGHKDLMQTDCPGKLFDFNYVYTLLRSKPTYEELGKRIKVMEDTLKQINQLSSL